MKRMTSCDSELKAQALQASKESLEIHGMSSTSKKVHRFVHTRGKCVKVGLGLVLSILSVTLGYHSLARVQQTISPVKRIALTATDDLGWGKSCEWVRHRWHCRECNGHGNCRTLKRRRLCSPFPRQEWDNPPRFHSHFDPKSNEDMDFRTLTKFGVGKVSKLYYENQPMCTVSTCFNLTRCNATILTIYTNTTGPHELLDYALKRLQNITKLMRVDNYEQACLVLVTRGMYNSADELRNARHWNGGRNNLLWDSACFFDGILCDSPFSSFHYERAALASSSLPRAHIRVGYDLTLPLARVWGRPSSSSSLHDVYIHRPRKWLLSFRGSIQDSLHPYYQHRWLAAEYWEDSDDVVVDVQCKHRKLLTGEKVITKPYRLPASSYDDMIWNSTFGFSPGGSSVGSYRFGEILSTGGIPVVTQDFVPPLHPEVDWSDCIVVISEARIIDLPRILRTYSKTEIEKRQRVCWRLLHNVIGDKKDGNDVWRGDPRVAFAKAMQVWDIRISNALERQQELLTLQQDTMSLNDAR
jgi:Exostosin family